MKLKDLLKGYSYVSNHITEKNFPKPKKIQTKNWKLIQMGKVSTSEEALAEIKKQGYRPANLWELATWVKKYKGKMFEGTYIAALQDRENLPPTINFRGMPYVSRDSNSNVAFYVVYFYFVWGGNGAFLCFRDSTLKTRPLEDKDSLTIEKAIELLKKEGYKIIKEI